MLTINAIHGLIHTVSTFLILALAVQATPLPASNSAQLVPRDVLVEPSTSIRSYDVVHSTHSHNSFDLSGILPRMNTPIKTASSHPHEEEVSHLTSSLDDLGKRAEAALRDKQVRLFATLLAQIHEYLSPYVSGHDSKIPSNVHDLAQQIYNNLMKKWDGGDKKDVVKPSGEVNVSHIHFTNHLDPWDPLDEPERLPRYLKKVLRPDIHTTMIPNQQLFDLGQSYIKQDTSSIILGYQLMLVSATLALDQNEPDFWSALRILYLIRDAEYADATSDHAKRRLAEFNKELTGYLELAENR